MHLLYNSCCEILTTIYTYKSIQPTTLYDMANFYDLSDHINFQTVNSHMNLFRLSLHDNLHLYDFNILVQPGYFLLNKFIINANPNNLNMIFFFLKILCLYQILHDLYFNSFINISFNDTKIYV